MLLGLYHSFIRMGSGLEFGLPGLIAEGLSLAASSGDWPTEFFVGAEKVAATKVFTHAAPSIYSDTDIKPPPLKDSEGKSLRALLAEIHNDKKIQGMQVTQGLFHLDLLACAKDEIISYAAQYRVRVDQIEEKNAESINVAGIYLAAPRHLAQTKLTTHPQRSCSAPPCGRIRKSSWTSS